MISALAVVVTLVILILDVRENSEIARASAYQTFRAQVNPTLVSRINDPEVARIWNEGLNDISALDEIEGSRFGAMLFMMVGNWESMFYLQQSGILDETMGANLAPVVKTNGFRQWWEGRRQNYNAEFVEYMEAQIYANADET